MSDSPGYTSPRHFQRTSRPSVSTGSPRPSVSSPLVRAHWPWTTYVQQRPTSAMSSPASTTAAHWEPAASTSVSSHSWQSITPTSRPTLQPAMQVTPVQEAHGIRQWSFSAFEWTVPNVRDLKKFVESQQVVSTTSSLHSEDSQTSHSNGIPAILRETPMVGDGKFKLEISRVAPSDETNPSLSVTPDSNEDVPPASIIIPGNSELTTATTLSLCLTSLQLDFLPDCEIATTVMAGIKADANFSGQRGARTEWVWETWEDFVFRKGSEFWDEDTGDVQFVCLERFDPSIHSGPEVNADPQQNSPSSNSPSPSARKRVIYAHSDILVRRSEYFAALITSSFRESAANPNLHDRELGRTMHTIVVEEADFVTIYWLLKYLYCDWLLFREDDDPRAAVDGMGAGWNARWLSQGNEWEWKTFSTETGQFEDLKDREDDSTAKSVASESVSGGSIVSDVSRGNKIVGLAPSAPSNRTPSRSGNSSISSTTLRPSNQANASISRRPGKLVTSNTIPSTSAASSV
ncbi:10343_t:CDS:2, partial [Acaulospora colombiana]